ncbi:hypothetical protein AGMMS49957_10580 [Synergistales bacterium]|nr:hypothetical protein AGMMS49957_10580 [Synergistales bacterium]
MDIPVSDFREGTSHLSIIMKKNDIYEKNDSAVSLSITSLPSPKAGVKVYVGPKINTTNEINLKALKWLTTNHSIDDVTIDARSVKDEFQQNKTIKIDTIDNIRPLLSITGWAFDVANKDSGGKLFIKIDDKFYNASRVDRDDVATHFNEAAYAKSGFALYIDTNELDHGRHDAQIILLTSDGKSYYVVSEFKIVVDED